MSLKQRPISFLEIRDTAQISAGGRAVRKGAGKNVFGGQEMLEHTFEGTRDPLLSAGDVEAGRGDGVVAPAFQALLLVNLLKQVICSVLGGSYRKGAFPSETACERRCRSGGPQADTHDDVAGEVDPVGHGADLLEGVQHGPIRAAHGPAVLVLGIAELVKAGRARSLRGDKHRSQLNPT